MTAESDDRVADPADVADAAAALQAIPYAPVASVATAYARAAIGHPLDGFGCLVPRKEQRRLLGVLFSGLLMGVLIGAILSLVLMLRRAMQPHTTELGRVPDTDYFANRIRHPENQSIPGVFIFRCDGGLLYFNVEHVRDRFFELMGNRKDEVKLVIFFLGTVPALDLAGVELLTELEESLRRRGITLRLAEARSNVRETLRRGGFERHYGPVEADQSISAILRKNPLPNIAIAT